MSAAHPPEIYYPTRLAKSPIHGCGVFSVKTIPARKKIGCMGGTIIPVRRANKKAKRLQVISLVELGNGKVLDGTKVGNNLSLVNHSCSPNAFIRIIGNHVEFYALKKIHPKEEITCSYGFSYHDGKKRCQCKSPDCAGFI